MATYNCNGSSPLFKTDNRTSLNISSPFGTRADPITGAASFHNGIDITGAGDIYPIADGEVIAVFKNCPGKDTKTHTAGNYVFIQHKDPHTGAITAVSKYMHLKYGSIPGSIQKGSAVTANTKIGYMGTTGYSTGVHLHFQIDKNGKPIDSLSYARGIKKDLGSITLSQAASYNINPEEGSGYQPSTDDVFSTYNYNIVDSDFVRIKHIAGVFGLPYQFLPTADIRLDGSKTTENIGYEYGEKIIERIPLLFLAPGKANFMTKYSKKNKESVLEKLLTFGNNDDKSSLSDLLDSDGRYYTFEYDNVNYYKFVNPMCRIAARYLGIQDIELNGSKLDKFNWESFTKSGIKSIGDFGSYTSVPFYVDADTSISESFSNSTTQSMLAGTVNSASDMAKELNFLLGYGAGTKNIAEAVDADGDITQSINNVADMATKLLGAGGFFSNLGSHLKTVASGGKLVFPEIWSDSSFSRQFNVRFKFIAPDPSNLSVYMNVLVPLFHLIALVAPQMPENNPNGYINPFLVRAIYKGVFNIDMGIITDMSVTKGAECQWTPEGVPTSIDVDIGIKDLYNAMSITSTKNTDWKYDTLNNTALMDYIANLCGINIYKPEITRIIDMWYTNNFSNRITDFFEVDLWGGVQQKVQNLIMNIYRK